MVKSPYIHIEVWQGSLYRAASIYNEVTYMEVNRSDLCTRNEPKEKKTPANHWHPVQYHIHLNY